MLPTKQSHFCTLLMFQASLREFSNLYNNLHFPNFKNVPPCIVIPLKYCEIIKKREEMLKSVEVPDSWKDDKKVEIIPLGTINDKDVNENAQNEERVECDSKNLLSYQVELPVCTVCLRRLQSTTSGVDGGNDIPVSMWFTGNIDRCQVCKVYGEVTESDGSQTGTGTITGLRAGIRAGSGGGPGINFSIGITETLQSSQVKQHLLYHFTR